MGGSIGLTDTQETKLQTFQEKMKAGKALTPLQGAENDRLVELKENPELPQGAQTYCQQWLVEKLYDRRKEFYSKACDKGNMVEEDSIAYVGHVLGLFLTKNEEYREDDYKTGTCDVDTGDLIIDVKNPETCFTFPLHDVEIPTSDYYYQLQGYMSLWNRQRSKLIYTLMDTPDKLLISEANFLARRLECDFQEAFDIVKKQNTYSHLTDELRYKEFNIERDDNVIQEIEERVKMCQKYVTELQSQITIGEF